MRLLAFCPSLSVLQADPGQVVMKSSFEGLHVRFSYEIASVIHDAADHPTVDFADRATGIFDAIAKLAEIRSLERIGHRLNYHTYLPKLDDAKKEIDRLRKSLRIGGAFLNDWNDPLINRKILSEFAVRLEEANTGIRMEVNTGEIEATASGAAKAFVNVDADLYTRTPVTIDSLIVDELVTQNRKWVEENLLTRLK